MAIGVIFHSPTSIKLSGALIFRNASAYIGVSASKTDE
jgi:hypothetical protein